MGLTLEQKAILTMMRALTDSNAHIHKVQGWYEDGVLRCPKIYHDNSKIIGDLLPLYTSISKLEREEESKG